MTDREYDKRKEQLDKYFDEFMTCIVKTFKEDPKYAFIAFESYASTFLLAFVPVDREATLIENLKVLKDHNEEVFLNATNNMVKGLTDPDYLDNEFEVNLEDEP